MLESYFGLRESLEELFERPVDLVTRRLCNQESLLSTINWSAQRR